MQKGVIEREEVYLAEEFGEDYLAYKKRVPRWL
jgi:protein-S-isoprenylcysteine O-methyltransferase Ste14